VAPHPDFILFHATQGAGSPSAHAAPWRIRQPGQSLEHLMDSGLDAAKTVSSLTLFEAAELESAGALPDRIGRRCGQTLERLS